MARRWQGYEVRFPAHRRALDTVCHSVSAERFHAVLMPLLGDAARLHAVVSALRADAVQVDGAWLPARAVIDGRGPQGSAHMRVAYQKFVGRELVLEQPHGQARPIIMDATVAQHDGYRFVYTLPFDERRILVEDTYYSTAPELDCDTLRARIDAYVAARGWRIAAMEREETGVLPIALSGDIARFWQEKQGVPCSGLRAGLFHATTGYSLPHAVRLADALATLDSFDAPRVFRFVQEFSTAHWRSQGFMRLLNRMLFFASAPAQRYRLLQRFYTLPPRLIERFYAARPTPADKLRILSGKPPVPVLAALRAMFTT